MNEPVSTPEELSGIAIVGMAGRFPQAEDITAFWLKLCAGQECTTRFSPEELSAAGVPPALFDDRRYVPVNGLLEDVDLFDASFFSMSPREASITDPQHRVFLELAWQALEHCGHDPASYRGAIGVYAGCGLSSYLLNNLWSNRAALADIGGLRARMANSQEYLATRVSYKLNLTGPSVSINTACSTSLVAVHLACDALLNFQCDMALGGGISIQVPQGKGYLYEEGGILSPDGHCRAFDAEAQGTVSGNGGAVVVLKRLADALADGDTIYAVIRGSAINNDGADKAGYTAPSVTGQANVIAEALAMADIDANTVGYIETHGTGTPLGDPIEWAALTRAFRKHTSRKQFCALGSVKTNVGHLDEAAGVAGLIKTALGLYHRQIPPSLHFKRPNPEIDYAASPFYVNAELRPWPPPEGDALRRAAVSSFGIGGTNAHVVLEEAPPQAPFGRSRPIQLVLLSARTETALDAASARLAAHLRQHQETLELADAAYTLQVGRRAFRHRRALVCRSADEAVAALEARDRQRIFSAQALDERPVAFMFPGQGSQHTRMCAGIYETEPAFREAVDGGLEFARTVLDLDLREALYPREPAATTPDGGAALDETALAQVALFIVEHALARLWMDWGVRPAAMLGHSVGEYVAACLAGVFSAEDALRLLAVRGQLMQAQPRGAMLAVPLGEEEVLPLLGPDLALAAVNGPELCVVAGEFGAVERFERELASRRLTARRLKTSHAFHSGMMEPIVDSFTGHVRQVRLNPPQFPFLSNVTGTWIKPSEATDPVYWGAHLRRTVRFADGLRVLAQMPDVVLLEVGPGRALTTAAAGALSCLPAPPPVLASLGHPREQKADELQLMTALGKLWAAGVAIDWSRFHARERRRRVALPTYPFERHKFWVEPVSEPATGQARPAGQPAKRPQIAEWFYAPSWKRAPLPRGTPQPPAEAGAWLVFVDENGIGERLAALLEQGGGRVFVANAGPAFARAGARGFTLDPIRASDYAALLAEIERSGERPEQIVHCWGVSSPPDNGDRESLFEAAQRLGYYSLLSLTQALQAHGLDERIRVTVLSAGAQEVTGDESIEPHKATLTGLIKVINQEYPGILCRQVDLDIREGGSEAALEAVVRELLAAPAETVVAYRGRHRWVQTFEPLPLPAPVNGASRLRQGGTYLLTGGLGGVGLILAQYLARQYQANLVLVGRSGLPPREEWGSYLSDRGGEQRIDLRIEDEAAGLELVRANFERESGIAASLAEYEKFSARLDRLCSSLARHFLQTCGVEATAGTMIGVADLTARLNLLPAYGKLLGALLRMLADDAIIRVAGDRIEFLESNGHVPPPEKLTAELNERFPQYRGITSLLNHCVAHYRPALSGEVPAISVLYPAGGSELLESAAADTTLTDNKEVLLRLVQKFVHGVADNSPGKRIRILEVGVGDGILGRVVAPGLAGRNVEYHATDLGRSFVLKAEKAAAEAGLDFMRFGALDIAADPIAQGYAPNSFDLILALDVVHATPNIAESIANLRRLLAPNGVLCLVEKVRDERWTDMVWGLAEGWWRFEDTTLRERSPLLSLERWEQVLRGQDFSAAQSYPGNPAERARASYGLILAQAAPAPAGATQALASDLEARRIRNAVEKIRRLEELGSRVLALRADVADERQMAAVIAETRNRFQKLDGVIHAAGITSGKLVFNLLRDTDRAQSEALFHPKVRGVYVLDRLLAGHALDFCLLISSNAAVLGGLGLAAYSAANCFMDAFATVRSRDGAPWVSANWDGWPTEQEIVGSVRVQTSIDQYAMTSAEAESAFERVVSLTRGQTIVSAGDLAGRIEHWTRRARQGPGEARGSDAARPDLLARAASDADEPAAGNELERMLVRIWQELLGADRVGLDDNFFALGGDSLIGLQLVSRINRESGIEMPIRHLFEEPTVAQLAARLGQLATEAATRIQPAPPQADYPLTHGQKRLWILVQNPQASVAYNMSYGLRLRGTLNLAALRRAFELVVERHESLRTAFITAGGEPRQQVRPPEPFQLPLRDVRGERDVAAAVSRETRAEALRPFCLTEPPLLRAALLRVAEDEYVLLVSLHHIIADGLSLNVLMRELHASYTALCAGRAPELPPLAIQSKDFAVWQQEQLAGEAMLAHRAYWLEKLGGELPLLALPTDYPRPPLQQFGGGQVVLRLPPAAQRALHGRCQEQGVTLFMLLVAALKVLLHQTTGQSDILLGSPMMGHEQSELEGQIGYYLNNVVLRETIQRGEAFTTLLQRVRNTVTEALAHQSYPFDLLVEDLAVKPSPGRSPLFDVQLNLMPTETPPLELGDLSVTGSVTNSQTTLFDLNFMFSDGPAGLVVEISYSTSLFDAASVERLGGRLLRLLAAVGEQPSLTVRALCELLEERPDAGEKAEFLAAALNLDEEF